MDSSRGHDLCGLFGHVSRFVCHATSAGALLLPPAMTTSSRGCCEGSMIPTWLIMTVALPWYLPAHLRWSHRARVLTSPLLQHLAASEGHKATVRLLLAASAHVNVTDRFGGSCRSFIRPFDLVTRG